MPTPKRLGVARVSLGPRSYDVRIGSGALAQMPKWIAKYPAKRAFIIADESLRDPRAAVQSILKKAGWEVVEIAVKAGESLKEIDRTYAIYGELLRGRANRESTIFALGGGTVGDVAGFVAATYQRGIPWVGLPTTLLAQVDSSIGGKTGINHAQGKNLIGAIYQPSLVVADTDWLKTLDKRDVVSGYAEVVKCALIFDPKLFASLTQDSKQFLDLESDTLSSFIVKAAQWKAKIVARDEADRKGVREVLNFGHTFGHALESATNYSSYRHGEAVLWGMRFALALSMKRKKLLPRLYQALNGFLSNIPCPDLPVGFGPESFIEKMKFDKKVKDGRVRFVLLKNLGKTVLDHQVNEQDLRDAFKLMMTERSL